MKKAVVYVLFATLLFPISVSTAADAPNLSSSLAKNLWRQCHMYYEDGMDAKATRACGELLAWAEKNNEAALAQETAGMVKTLKERQQPAPAAPAPKAPKKSELQPDQPLCGYAAIEEVPDHILLKTVTKLPPEFIACDSDADCVAATGYCGAKVAVSKMAQACFESLSTAMNQKIGCGDSLDEMLPFRPVCHEKRCLAQF